MARIKSVYTNKGLGYCRLTTSLGFLIQPKRFAVTDLVGVVDPNRNLEDMLDVWYEGPITSHKNDIQSNQITIYCTIPPQKAPMYTKVREVYLIAERSDTGEEFLLTLGQPTDIDRVEYDPDGSLTLRIVVSLANVPAGNVFGWKYTQAAEVQEHNTDRGAHKGGLPLAAVLVKDIREVLDSVSHRNLRIASARNIKSITAVSQGTFDVQFKEMMPSENYFVTSGGGGIVEIDVKTAQKTRSGCRIKTYERFAGTLTYLGHLEELSLMFWDMSQWDDPAQINYVKLPISGSISGPDRIKGGEAAAFSLSVASTAGNIASVQWSLGLNHYGSTISGNGTSCVVTASKDVPDGINPVWVLAVVTDTAGNTRFFRHGICLTEPVKDTGMPIGGCIPWFSWTIPPGYLIADGSPFDKNLYPGLAKYFPNGFLPDTRGVVLRGLDNGRGLDPGRGLATYQGDQNREHKHIVPAGERHERNDSYPWGVAMTWQFGVKAGEDYDNPWPWSSPEGGAEARMRNLSCFYIVKAYGSVENQDAVDLAYILQRLQYLENLIKNFNVESAKMKPLYGIPMNANIVAPSDGFVCVNGDWGGNNSAVIFVNGAKVFHTCRRDKYGQGPVSGCIPVAKGDVYQVRHEDGTQSAWFRPLS